MTAPSDESRDRHDPHETGGDETIAPSQAERELMENPPKQEDEIPDRLGRYEVQELKGSGAYGAVYLGFDPQLQRRVAIKVPRLGDQAIKESEFLQEARQLAQLHHPGIVTVYDVGTQDGRCYIVSDYLEGASLRDWLAANQPTWQQSAQIVAALADALAYAHAHRTVHRDVKPENIIMRDSLQPVLIDFGLALTDTSVVESELGTISGTPNYMSPEQASGRGHRIDGRTDIYALGVLLYRMVCGRTPFQAKGIAGLLRQVREDEPQPPRQLTPALPPQLESICLKAMAKRPEDRYTTAGDMATALRAVVEQMQPVLQPGTTGADDQWPTGQDGHESARASQQSTKSDSQASVDSSHFSTTARRLRDAERRQVTVLYCECDLFDSAHFLEQLDVDDQHEVLEAYLQACQDAVAQYDGAVMQSTGRGFLACFGYPVAHEDAAKRAAHAGLRMQHAIAQLNGKIADLGVKLAAWVGIHTGMVIAKTTPGDASPEPMSIVGEARSVATQLQAAADVGDVVVSEATQQLIAGFFTHESLGTHTLKGTSHPLEVFRVVKPTTAQTRLDVVEPSALTPLVGREVELGMIRQRWEQTTEGSGQVVLLIGDAGIGKSRLVHETRAHVKSLGGQVIEWRCSPYYANSSLYSAVDYFERRLQLHDDTPAQRLDKLIEHLTEHKLQDAVPLFASLLSIPVDDRFPPLQLGPQRIKELLLQALLDWLQSCATQQQTLFIIEDLHWVDPTTLEFVSLLMNEDAGDGFLTVFTFRPEFVTPWTSAAHQTQIPLNKLTKAQIGEMARMQLGVDALPDSLVTRIVDRTDGVPLFVEEFTKVIRETGVLDASRNAGDQATVSLDAIPNTLQDLLASRLDRMDSAHDVVQLGATLGREFSYEVLSAVYEGEEAVLEQELGKLVKAQLLFQKGRLPTATYTFKHALIQDAAYQSIVRRQRQGFHQRIGEVLQSQFPEVVETEPELLAHHFTAAGDKLTGISYWLKAGQRAQAHCAVVEAMSHLQRGLELIAGLEDGPQKDQLELGFQLPMGAVLLQAKGYANEQVGRTFMRARELCERLGPEAPLFHVLWGMWVWNVVLNRLDTSFGYANELIELANQTHDDGFIMEARFCRGVTQIYKGEFADAREHLSTAFDRYDEERCNFHSQFTGQNCGPLSLTYNALGIWCLGYPDEALRVGKQAVDLAKQVGHPFTLAFALYHYGWLQQCCGSGELVEQQGREGYQVSYEGGFQLWETLGTLNIAVGRLLQGGLSAEQAAEAMRQAQAGLNGFMATGAQLHISHCYGLFASLLLEQDKLDEAETELEKGFAASAKYNEVCDLAELHRLQGELLLRRKGYQAAEAEACFQRAIEIARDQAARSWELRACMSLARLWRDQGRQTEARQRLAEIYEWFTEGFDTPDLIAAKQLLAELAE